jgi:YVTN family beta-propeller protein
MKMRWFRLSAALGILVVIALVASTTAASAQSVGPRIESRLGISPDAITLKTITVGSKPGFALYDPANKDVYVANEGSATVSAISSTTYAVTTVKVGTEPLILTYSPSSTDLYVLNFEKSITVISSANKVLTTITPAKGAIPFTQAYDPANGDVYVVCVTTTTPEIVQINHATYAQTAIPLPTGSLEYVTYDNATSSLVVSDGEANELSVISSSNVVTTVKLTAGEWPTWMVYNPHDSDLYIVDIGETSHGYTKTGNVSILASSNKITATVKTGELPTIATYDPKNFDIYAVDTGVPSGKTYPTSSVTIISGTKLVKTLTIGKYGVVASYDPSNTEMYIACPASNLTYTITNANAAGPTVVTKQYAGATEYDPALGDMIALGITDFLGASAADTLATVIPSSNTGTSTLTLGEGPVAGGAWDPTDSGLWEVNGGTTSVTVIL